MKAYITKYALTKGIEEVEGKIFGVGGTAFSWGAYGYAHGPNEWSYTLAEAKVVAEARRVARIASLKKSIAKLEKLSFA